MRTSRWPDASASEALARSPQDWTIHQQIAVVCERIVGREPALALHHLEEALRLAPNEAGLHDQFGELLLRLSPPRHQEAAAAFTRAIELGGLTADRLLARGDCHWTSGRHEAALADFEQGVALAPGDWRFYNRRGEIHMQQALKSPSPTRDRRWVLAAEDYSTFRRLRPALADPEPRIRLITPPERTHGLVFDLCLGPEERLADRALSSTNGEVNRQLREDVFIEFAGIFRFEDRLAWYGISRYPPAVLEVLRERASAHRRSLDAIGSYQDFFDHAAGTGWLLELIRSCGDHERRWEGWLADLKQVSEQLLALIDEARAHGWALWIGGI